jgi:hypothetical protein
MQDEESFIKKPRFWKKHADTETVDRKILNILHCNLQNCPLRLPVIFQGTIFLKTAPFIQLSLEGLMYHFTSCTKFISFVCEQ